MKTILNTMDAQILSVLETSNPMGPPGGALKNLTLRFLLQIFNRSFLFENDQILI